MPSKPWWPLLGGAKVCLTSLCKRRARTHVLEETASGAGHWTLATSASKGSRRQWPQWGTRRVRCGASERVGPVEALPFSPGLGGAWHAPPLHREQIPWPPPPRLPLLDCKAEVAGRPPPGGIGGRLRAQMD